MNELDKQVLKKIAVFALIKAVIMIGTAIAAKKARKSLTSADSD
jgi:hypothetical protein